LARSLVTRADGVKQREDDIKSGSTAKNLEFQKAHTDLDSTHHSADTHLNI